VNPLIRVIPAFLVRFFASPYVAGDSLAKAIDVVQKLRRERGLWSTLDLLAEDIRTDEQARQNVDAYLQMVDAAAALPADVRPTLSMKPSSYTTKPMQHGGDAAGSLAALRGRGLRIVGADARRVARLHAARAARREGEVRLVRVRRGRGWGRRGAVCQRSAPADHLQPRLRVVGQACARARRRKRGDVVAGDPVVRDPHRPPGGLRSA
jgi:hypothetical protein